MQFVAFSDLHLHKYPYSKILQNGDNELFEAGLKILSQVYQYCTVNSIERIYFIGDLFVHRDEMDVDIYCNKTFDWLKALFGSNSTIELHIIAGNHDQVNISGKTFLRPLAEIKNVHLYESISAHNYQDTKIHVCPYQEDVDNVYKGLASSNKDDIILMHQLLLNSPTLSDHVFKKRETIDVSKLKFSYLFSGHNHRPFENDIKTVFNLGSPMHHTFSDTEYPDRFFIHFNSKFDNPVKWVPTEFPIFSEEDGSNRKSATYIRPKRQNVKQIDTRMNIVNGDSSQSILQKYIEYKGEQYDLELINEGLFLLGEKV